MVGWDVKGFQLNTEPVESFVFEKITGFASEQRRILQADIRGVEGLCKEFHLGEWPPRRELLKRESLAVGSPSSHR